MILISISQDTLSSCQPVPDIIQSQCYHCHTYMILSHCHNYHTYVILSQCHRFGVTHTWYSHNVIIITHTWYSHNVFVVTHTWYSYHVTVVMFPEMSCLLAAYDDKRKLTKDCYDKLKDRVTLWEYAVKVRNACVIISSFIYLTEFYHIIQPLLQKPVCCMCMKNYNWVCIINVYNIYLIYLIIVCWQRSCLFLIRFSRHIGMFHI